LTRRLQLGRHDATWNEWKGRSPGDQATPARTAPSSGVVLTFRDLKEPPGLEAQLFIGSPVPVVDRSAKGDRLLPPPVAFGLELDVVLPPRRVVGRRSLAETFAQHLVFGLQVLEEPGGVDLVHLVVVSVSSGVVPFDGTPTPVLPDMPYL
jgi:hypothetical protein